MIVGAWASSGAGNPANPCDSVGYYHDLGLNFIAENDLDSLQPWISGPAAFAVYEGWIPSDSIASLEADLIRLSATDSVVWDTVVTSSLFKTYLTDIVSICDTSSDPANLISGIKILEGQILSGSLSTNERPWIMRYTSVLRYSTAYWGGVDRLPWHLTDTTWGAMKQSGKMKTLMPDPSKVKRVAVSDGVGAIWGAATGFVFGGLFGLIGGSVFGPAGTLVGAAGGAIIGSGEGAVQGAIVNSVKTAITGS